MFLFIALWYLFDVWTREICENVLEMRGIEPRAFHMQSERSTTELHPQCDRAELKLWFLLECKIDDTWTFEVPGEHTRSYEQTLNRVNMYGSVAERSKALVLGTSLFGGVGSNPTAATGFEGKLVCEPWIPEVTRGWGWRGAGVQKNLGFWQSINQKKHILICRSKWKLKYHGLLESGVQIPFRLYFGDRTWYYTVEVMIMGQKR